MRSKRPLLVAGAVVLLVAIAAGVIGARTLSRSSRSSCSSSRPSWLSEKQCNQIHTKALQVSTQAGDPHPKHIKIVKTRYRNFLALNHHASPGNPFVRPGTVVFVVQILGRFKINRIGSPAHPTQRQYGQQVMVLEADNLKWIDTAAGNEILDLSVVGVPWSMPV